MVDIWKRDCLFKKVRHSHSRIRSLTHSLSVLHGVDKLFSCCTASLSSRLFLARLSVLCYVLLCGCEIELKSGISSFSLSRRLLVGHRSTQLMVQCLHLPLSSFWWPSDLAPARVLFRFLTKPTC